MGLGSLNPFKSAKRLVSNVGSFLTSSADKTGKFFERAGRQAKGVGDFFSGPDLPEAPPLPPIDNTEQLKNAARLEAERLRKRKGMKSAWLTQSIVGLGGEQVRGTELLGG